MNNLWLKIKIWAKIALVAAVFVYVILFVYFNAGEKVRFWYWFHPKLETTLLLLVLCSFVAGLVASFLARTTFRTIRQVQDLRARSRMHRLDREMADMRAKAAMLQTRPPTAPEAGPATPPQEPPP